MEKSTKRSAQFGQTAAEASYEEQVRRRAYELYEARGRAEGHDIEDWLEAEAEINVSSEKAAA